MLAELLSNLMTESVVNRSATSSVPLIVGQPVAEVLMPSAIEVGLGLASSFPANAETRVNQKGCCERLLSPLIVPESRSVNGAASAPPMRLISASAACN